MAHQWLEALKQMVPFSGKHFCVISNILVALVFWGLQELLQRGFKCPNHSDYNVGYSCLFLIGPSVILILLTALLTKECQCYCPKFCCKVKYNREKCSNCVKGCPREVLLYYFTNILNSCYYGCVWIVVVFLDGDCLSCMLDFGSDTLNKTTEDYGKDEMGSSAEKKPLKFETISRIIGIILLLVLVIIACILNCCRCCMKPYSTWQYQQIYAEEMQEIICENLKYNAKRNAKVHYNELIDNAKSATDPERKGKRSQPEEPQPFTCLEFWKETSCRKINEPRSYKLEPTEETKANNINKNTLEHQKGGKNEVRTKQQSSHSENQWLTEATESNKDENESSAELSPTENQSFPLNPRP